MRPERAGGRFAKVRAGIAAVASRVRGTRLAMPARAMLAKPVSAFDTVPARRRSRAGRRSVSNPHPPVPMLKSIVFAAVGIAVLAVDHHLQQHGGHGMPRWLMAAILVRLGLWLRIDFGDDDDAPRDRYARIVLLPLAGGFCIYLAIVGWTLRDTFIPAPPAWVLRRSPWSSCCGGWWSWYAGRRTEAATGWRRGRRVARL